MARESVQNVTGQLQNTRGAAIAGDSYLNVISIGPCTGSYFLQVIMCK